MPVVHGRARARDARRRPPRRGPEVGAPSGQPAAALRPARPVINPRLLRRFRPVASAARLASPAQPLIDLGRELWFDARLSRDGDLSCNSCHALDHYGVDGAPTSTGTGGRRDRRNSPTVFNAGLQFAQFWDGRAKDLEAQALGPLNGPDEMAMTPARVAATLTAIPGYRALFARAFPGESHPLDMAHVARALAAFESGMVTHGRWDDYLAGHSDELSDAEIDGLRRFIEVGCITCHTGPQVGASLFQKAGVFEPWPNQADQGRYEVTHDPVDRMYFKVPSLENVGHTAPYFHDGSADDLETAVRLMARRQLGVTLDDDEATSIATFLRALSGDLPTAYIERPQLPASAPAAVRR
ncbi:MAG: cytochrome c peroxidase [Myxococcota bacterium]